MTYLDFKRQLMRSGSDSVLISWTYYDSINEILGSSVATEPKYTFAVGAQKIEKRKGDSSKENTDGAKKRQKGTKLKKNETGKPEKKKKPTLSLAAQKLRLEEKN